MAKVKFNPFFDEFNWIKQKLAISLNQSVLLELDYYSYFGFFVLIFLFYCIIFIVFKIRNFDSIKSKIQNYQYLLIFTLFSSYVFTVSHFKVYDLNLPKFLQLFATGIFFAIIRIKYSFRLSIILHILGNSLILFRELLFTEATNNYLGLLQIFVTFIIVLCVLFYIFENKTLLKK